MTEKLCCGLPTQLIQNQWYALPPHICTIFCSATTPTFFQSSDATVTPAGSNNLTPANSVAVTLVGGSAQVVGTHLRVTSAVAATDRIILNRA